MAAQLEEGYLKTKPWAYPENRARRNSGVQNVTPKASTDNLKATAKSQPEGPVKPLPLQSTAPHQPQTYRLFGTYSEYYFCLCIIAIQIPGCKRFFCVKKHTQGASHTVNCLCARVAIANSESRSEQCCYLSRFEHCVAIIRQRF